MGIVRTLLGMAWRFGSAPCLRSLTLQWPARIRLANVRLGSKPEPGGVAGDCAAAAQETDHPVATYRDPMRAKPAKRRFELRPRASWAEK